MDKVLVGTIGLTGTSSSVGDLLSSCNSTSCNDFFLPSWGEPWGEVWGEPWGEVWGEVLGEPWGEVLGEPWGEVLGEPWGEVWGDGWGE